MRNFSFSRFSASLGHVLPLILLLSISSCEKGITTSNLLQPVSLTQQDINTDNLAAGGIDTAGLVAWFDFNNGSLEDRSSYHNKIKFNNAQPATDRKGIANNAYYFNGNGSYMAVANSPSLNPSEAITLFAIVNISDFYEGKCHGNRIISKGYYDSDQGFYDMDFADALYTNHANCEQAVDKAHQSFDANFGRKGATDSTEFVQTNHWYHIIYTYQNKVGKLYVDGKLVSVYHGGGFFAANSYDVCFGTTNKSQHEYPYWFNGSIDQIGIFNVAINETQVARLTKF